MKKSASTILSNQNGAVLIWFVLFLPILIGMVAMAVDVSRLAVAKNELQNAADAGALAAARFLYNDNGSLVNTGANQIGKDAAVANDSENLPVEVNWTGGNEGDVQRGHWSFGLGTTARGFYPNPSQIAVPLEGQSAIMLDENTDFINAVKVTVRREGTPIISYFARIFGIDSWSMNASAVAYLGFPGSLAKGEVDLPIAICSQALTGKENCCPCDPPIDDGCTYSCTRGFMLSDGQTKNSAAWTNFSNPCSTADTTSLRDLLTCGDANTEAIGLCSSIGATNGVVDAVIDHPNFASLMDCWRNGRYDSTPNDPDDNEEDGVMKSIDTDGDSWPDVPWNVTLPVVNCPNSQVSNCMPICGAVNVDILWILEKENDIDADAPKKMGKQYDAETQTWDFWESSEGGVDRWNDFVGTFAITNPDGLSATVANDGFKMKSVYFKPDCEDHELTGDSDGSVPFGVLARRPKLVQ